MTRQPWPNIASTLSAAEQAAHPMSGPRRRPHELPGSFPTNRGATHVNCSPMIPARFTGTESPIAGIIHSDGLAMKTMHSIESEPQAQRLPAETGLRRSLTERNGGLDLRRA